MWRRGFAFLLSLTLLLTAVSLGALAAETVLYGETGDAVVTVRANDAGAVTVSASELEQAVESALSNDGQTPVVEIRVKLSEGAARMTLSLPVEVLETLGQHSGAVLSITSALAGVELDSDAMASVAYQAAGQTADLTVAAVAASQLSERQRQVAGNAPVYMMSLSSNSEDIYTFGAGVVTMQVPHELSGKQLPAGVVVWSMDEYNRLTDCDTSYDSAAEVATFATRRCSLFVVGYETPVTIPFTDVSGSYWAYGEIAWAYEKGLMTGKTDTSFQPEGTMTRQQVWMILARLSGANPASMAEAKAWAMQNGVSDGSDPGAAVTRQQLVTLLYRYAEMMGYSVEGKADLSGYPDAASISGYAAVPMAWAVGNNVVSGTGEGYLNPGVTASRAQFAVILWRFWGAMI